jgi:alpha-glucosidase
VINNSDQPVEKDLSVWDLNVPKEAVMKRLILTSEEGFDTSPVEYAVIGGRVKVSMPKTSALVLEYLDF